MREINLNKLWYNAPAAGWLDAMPLGNGKLGAMVYGRSGSEIIQFNEDTVWTRAAEDMNNPDSLKYLPEVRRLLLEGSILEAQELASITQFAIPNEQPAYQVLGELKLISMGQFTAGLLKNYPEHVEPFSEGFSRTKTVDDYYRELDMQSALAQVSYSYDATRYRREHFISERTNTFAARFTANGKAKISLYAQFFREFDAIAKPVAPDTLAMDGRAGALGSRYYMEAKFCPVGGTVEAIGQHIVVKDADELFIYVSAATDYRHEDYRAKVAACIAEASATPYEALKAKHIACHRELYDRAALTVRGDVGNDLAESMPMDERIALWRNADTKVYDDFDFISQYFNFVRYELITASRAGSMPMNLQGIWCNEIWPSWECKFTTNINFEMNYWAAEAANLHECHTAMFDHIDRVVENGKKTARIHYGCRGFTVHSNTDLWADTAAVDNVYCGLWPAGGGWLSLHLWQAYRYGRDLEFLKKRAYPVLREAALFYVDFLVEDGKGRLVFGPSVSPENSYYDKNGYRVGLTMGATMDHSIIRETFAAVKQAAAILGETGDPLLAEIDAALEKLAPLAIGERGTILEWLEDYERMLPGHRHLSHLFGICPGDEITPERTPAFAQAARKSLEERIAYGSGASGWSGAWAAGIWARLDEGERAYWHIKEIFRINTSTNLFDMHPPLPPGNDKYVFQIDGNGGTLSALVELLIQSRDGAVLLLPCLPAAWKEGSVRGLRAEGGVTVDMTWQDAELRAATVRASVNTTLALLTTVPIAIEGLASEPKPHGKRYLTIIEVKAGGVYQCYRQR